MELIVSFLIIGLLGGIAGDDTRVPHWENLECEVEILSTILLYIIQQNLSGWPQVPLLGRAPQLGGGAGRVRAVRRLAGQHRRGQRAELPRALRGQQGLGGQVLDRR